MPVAPLPTELVSSIVAAYFDSVAPFSLATPKSTPTPSNVAVAQPLLLASRALRRLTLPHVYRSLTIARRSDWLTLFHPERGLLARTPEGDERWSWLEELCVVSNVEPPWNEEGSLQTGNSASWFGPMLVPRAEEGGAGIWMATTRRRRSLPKLCFLFNPTAPSIETDAELDHSRRIGLSNWMLLMQAGLVHGGSSSAAEVEPLPVRIQAASRQLFHSFIDAVDAKAISLSACDEELLFSLRDCRLPRIMHVLLHASGDTEADYQAYGAAQMQIKRIATEAIVEMVGFEDMEMELELERAGAAVTGEETLGLDEAVMQSEEEGVPSSAVVTGLVDDEEM